jgi:hypothetical protein
MREQEVSKMIDGESSFYAVTGCGAFEIDNPCIVDEYLDPWVAGQEFLSQTANLGLRRQICQRHRNSIIARGSTDRCARLGRTLWIPTDQNNCGAHASQSKGGGSADSRTGPCDDTNLLVHVVHDELPGSIISSGTKASPVRTSCFLPH